VLLNKEADRNLRHLAFDIIIQLRLVCHDID